MKLTRENIFAGRSGPGGWNKHQLAVLGVSWPPVKGWLSQLIDKDIPDEDYSLFLRLRGVRRQSERASIVREARGSIESLGEAFKLQ